MKTIDPSWQKYERLIARLLVEQLETGLCVTPNANVLGKISQRSRQLDVLIDARHDTDNSRRIIVDAKMRKRKIDIPQVEAFRGLMEDVDASHGYIVCPVGHTAAAERRAQESVRICLVPLDHLEGFDPSAWPNCLGAKCRHGRVFWDGFPEITMVLVPAADSHGEIRNISHIHYVGKCDRCGRFHVKCLTCNDFFSLDGDEGDHRCKCHLPWFWHGSIENDEEGRPSAELHVVLPTGVMTVDRKSL